MQILNYFARLSIGKMILWCYLVWYLAIVILYFDPNIRIWLNSAGICVIIGIALILSVADKKGSNMNPWQVFRLFAMPFCVSSFSSLIKGQDFIFIVPPRPFEQMIALGSCLALIGFIGGVKVIYRRSWV